MNKRESFYHTFQTLLPGLMLAMGVATTLNLIILGEALNKIRDQAKDGDMARATQCVREPIIDKLVLAGTKYNLLTKEDLADFRRTSPRGCEKSPFNKRTP